MNNVTFINDYRSRKGKEELAMQEDAALDKHVENIAEYLYGTAPLEERQHLHPIIMGFGANT